MLIVLIRTCIMYAALLLSVRLMGKSELSKMSPFQLVVVFMIAELAAIPIDSQDASLVNGLIAIFALMLLQIALSYFSMKSEGFKNFISGKPAVIIENGQLNVKELKRQRISTTDLLEQLRIDGCPSVSDVEYAVLEANGQLSVRRKAETVAVTPKDLGLPVSRGALPVVIISDGNLYSRNLSYAGMDAAAFEARLQEAGVGSVKDVFLAFCDSDRRLHIYLADKNKGGFTKEITI